MRRVLELLQQQQQQQHAAAVVAEDDGRAERSVTFDADTDKSHA